MLARQFGARGKSTAETPGVMAVEARAAGCALCGLQKARDWVKVHGKRVCGTCAGLVVESLESDKKCHNLT